MNKEDKRTLTEILSIAALSTAAGAITGAYHAKGQNMSPETIETMLKSMPLIGMATGAYQGVRETRSDLPSSEKKIIPVFAASIYGVGSGVLWLAGYGAGQLYARNS